MQELTYHEEKLDKDRAASFPLLKTETLEAGVTVTPLQRQMEETEAEHREAESVHDFTVSLLYILFNLK